MIALDPEFLGGFAPQSLPATESTDKGTMSFARQPRLHRLHIQGKADETENATSEDEAAVKESSVGSGNPSKRDRAGKGKRKMRGKDKSLKRLVIHILVCKKTYALNWFRRI
jgi:U3 small nucleolar RNA-associated protein 7